MEQLSLISINGEEIKILDIDYSITTLRELKEIIKEQCNLNISYFVNNNEILEDNNLLSNCNIKNNKLYYFI
jgi:hypothetical protein